jgi:hypothetical protein
LKLNSQSWGERKAGILQHGSQWETAKPKSCPHVQKGIILIGDGIGQVKSICADRSCKEHFGSRPNSRGDDSYARKQKAEEQKAKRETERRRRILLATSNNVEFASFTELDLAAIAIAFYKDIWSEYRKMIAKAEGWELVKANGSHGVDYDAIGEKHMATMGKDDLARILVKLSLIKNTQVSTYDTTAGKKSLATLLAAATRWVVDVPKIDAQLKLEEEAKSKPKGKGKLARGRMANEIAKGNGKAEPATSYDEPMCFRCGCTEGMPCVSAKGSCSWTYLQRPANIGICSECEPNRAKAKKAVLAAVQTSAR